MIFGVFQRHGGDTALLEAREYHRSGVLRQTFPAVGSGCWENASTFLAQQHAGVLPPWRVGDAPEVDKETGCVVCAWARLDNRAELSTRLSLSATAHTDAGMILHAWRRWGEQLVDHLAGDYVFAIFDPRSQQLFCARDRLGVKPFYYQITDDYIVFSSSLLPIQKSTVCDLTVDQHWLAEYLLGISTGLVRTPYRSVFKLAPAHSLTVGVRNHVLRRYYSMATEPTLCLRDSREYVDAYQEMLTEAVRSRLVRGNDHAPLGAELSGGLDSSTLTALASRLLPEPHKQLHAFSHLVHVDDEKFISKIRETTPLSGSHYLDLDPDNFEHRVAVTGYPHEQAVPTRFYERAEQLGIRVMLSGFGGDELVTADGRQATYELYATGELKKLFDILPGGRLRRILNFIVVIYRSTLAKHLGGRTDRRALAPLKQRWDMRVLSDDYLTRHPSLRDDFFRPARFRVPTGSANILGIHRIQSPHVATRLENGTLIGTAYQIENRWPLLDHRLIDLVLSIPPEEKFHRGTTRWLHRRAASAWLPAEVAWNPSKGMGEMRKAAYSQFVLAPPEYEYLPDLIKEIVDPDRLQSLAEMEPTPYTQVSVLHPLLKSSYWASSVLDAKPLGVA